jgi:hypothetical protein
MTTKRAELKRFFRNGEVPSGDHFTSLIDSMVHVDEFHDWRETGEIDLGDGAWRVYVDSARRFVVVPEGSPAPRPALALSPEGGWAEMQGRVGSHDPAREAAAATKAPELTVPLGVPADGKWHSIIDNLEGCHAFEVVAKAAGPAKSRNEALTHVIALTSAAGSSASVQQAPARGAWFWRPATLVLLVVFLTLISGLPQKYLEIGRASEEAVKKASTIVHGRKAELTKLTTELNSDGIDLYPSKCSGGVLGQKHKEVTVDMGIVDFDKGEEIRCIYNHYPDRLQITVYGGSGGKGMSETHRKEGLNDVTGTIKSVKVTAAPAFDKKMKGARSALDKAEQDLDEVTQSGRITRYIGRALPYAEPVGIAGLLGILLGILVSHWRSRAAIKAKWRRQKGHWLRGGARYNLCLRTGHDYGADASGAPVAIHYHITKLWG